MSTTSKNRYIGPMMMQLGIFQGLKFTFNTDSAYFKRHKGTSSLAKEWEEQWNECAHGRADGRTLDILWCAWIDPE